MLRDHPKLDVGIHCAGIMRKLDLQKTTDLTDVTREIETNLNGTIRTNLAFLDHLYGRPEAILVNVSSGLAFVPLPVAPIYSAAKAGLRAYTQSLRLPLNDTRIRVVELVSPSTDTPLFYDDFTKVDTGGLKPMPVDAMVRNAIHGMERVRTEIRPDLSNVLNLLGRIAPGYRRAYGGKGGGGSDEGGVGLRCDERRLLIASRQVVPDWHCVPARASR